MIIIKILIIGKVEVNRLDDENEFNVGSSGHWNLVNYGNPLISLITETLYNSTYVDNMFFLTEKTSKSILIGQIFLVIGTKNFHKNLKDIGFKLYDEIFDYSFDSMDDDYRIEYVIKQIHNLKNSNYKEIYNIVKNKVEYNKELGFELLKNNNILFDSYTNNFVNQNINTFNKIINDGFLEKYII